MDRDAAFQEIVQDTQVLLKETASARGKLVLSPEVAALLDGLAASAPAPAVAAAVAPVAAEEAMAQGLPGLDRQVVSCTQCGLHKTRNKTVFGDGNPNADLVFVGEAPGRDEDRQGKPFIGRAGQLLTDIIVKGMKLRREDVYICNVLKCRPPDNRDPNPEEVRHCEPYLLAQLDLIRPKVVCALGGVAAKTLLRTTDSVGRMRGKWHNYHGIPLRVTYHPAYLLRSPGEKGKCWEDIQEVMKVLTGEVTPEI